MPRISRVVAAGYPHHITQRGNYRQEIFADDVDREKYLTLLVSESKRYGLTILAYCLMSNHVHLIGVPEDEGSLGKVFKYVNMKYSQYYNKKRGKMGHLFQGRFFSCVMDDRHTMACVRYIERNPIRAKLVENPWDWEWSSAKVHCGMSREDKLGVRSLFNYTDEREESWQRFIGEPDKSNEFKKIREQTRKGRPLGDIVFIEKLEQKLDRLLKFKPRGRPKVMV